MLDGDIGRFQDMISDLKGALSGSLETVILGLMKSTTQYDASAIRGSIKVGEEGGYEAEARGGTEGQCCPLLVI